jgi:threonine aldolase
MIGSSGRFVPLSSDTETRPTAAMRQAIANAEVGDEQRGEDPAVNALQERVAALLGKEAALWLPTGTMCNVVAIKVHTKPGDAIVAEAMAHIIRAESGGASLISGVLIEPIATERGIFTADQLRDAVRSVQTLPIPYGPPVRLVCVEQTHNFGGGAVWTVDELRAVSESARELGLAVHMDGARLLNATAATGVSASAFAAMTDTVWIDFTKGLGAPIGAVLAGTAAFIAEARRYKQLFGGAMRQAGIAGSPGRAARRGSRSGAAPGRRPCRHSWHPRQDAAARDEHRVLRHERHGTLECRVPRRDDACRRSHGRRTRTDSSRHAPGRERRRHRARHSGGDEDCRSEAPRCRAGVMTCGERRGRMTRATTR